ncbi:MAG: nicotinate (nicotinamide) nucleotide adenylyltransferase [Deltaproteobacteria bacterium]|nr:nicotinate (nicotinamide) nucleotide adenylyltransferase [Deltaproteobacteria bacterium]MBW2081069.1 nicotinate (nicotinamide) nucleotide adenylyltransferase [Deltaproteobacteria bacterium]
MRIGLLGGTLDPVHFGHLRSAEEIREALELDEIWFMPAALPPHKELSTLTSFAHRLAMVELAVTSTDPFKATAIEDERPGPSYSIDTLKELGKRYKNEAEFFFILGSDAFLDIETWKDYGSLTDYGSLVIMRRGREDSSGLNQVISRAFPNHRIQGEKDIFIAHDKGTIYLYSVTHLAISGTDIRRRARAGLSVRFLVPEEVRIYMEKNSLYAESAGDSSPSLKDEESKVASLEEPAQQIVEEILESKGEQVVILDMRGFSSLADFFIISQGRSTKHVQGIANKLRKNLRKKGTKCRGVEGEQEGKWILMDYGDVIVHLFYEPIRDFYDLEGLWSEVPKIIL